MVWTWRVRPTQVRPATNEEAEGIETVTSLLPNLTEAVREGRTRHFADITDEGDPEGDEPKVVEGDVMDVRLGRPDSQPEPELNSNAPSHSSRSETHAEPKAEASTSAGTDMEIGVGHRRVRFREERFSETSSGRILGPRVDGGTPWENAETSKLVRATTDEHSRCKCSPNWRATLPEHDRGRTFGRLQNDDATRPTRTMDADQR